MSTSFTKKHYEISKGFFRNVPDHLYQADLKSFPGKLFREGVNHFNQNRYRKKYFAEYRKAVTPPMITLEEARLENHNLQLSL